MTAELIAIGLQFAFTVSMMIAGVFLYKREKKDILDRINIERLKGEFMEIVDEKFNIEELKLEFTQLINIGQLKEEFTDIVDERLQAAIDTIGESFGEILTNPTVKKAFSIIGSQGGDAKATNVAIDSMAKDVLDGPQFSAIKMGAEMIGVDIDAYIEKYGAVKSIKAAQQLGSLVGIDIMNIDLSNLSIPSGGGGGSVDNVYLGR